METAYTAFATQVIELCSGNVDTNRTIIAMAYIEIELQHHPVRNLPEEKREVAAYISKALSFVRKMQKFLAAPQVPPLIPIRTSSDNTTENPASPLQWTGNTFSLALMYDQHIGVGSAKVPVKFSGVWGMQDLFGLKGVRFSGFLDIWGNDSPYGKFSILTEPQLWYFLDGEHLNIGTELELSYNFAGRDGFMFNPCLGLKWVF